MKKGLLQRAASIEPAQKFSFATLGQDRKVRVPVDGNKFFNKHFAIVGSTGSGKSHTLAKILQEAIASKSGSYAGLNNSHIVLFDIHGEYKTAFPNANVITTETLVLPYWLLSSEELEELFLDTEGNDHNQRNVFKSTVIAEKIASASKRIDAGKDCKIHYDSPTFFDIEKVLEYARFKNEEQIDTGEVYGKTAQKAGQPKMIQGSLYGELTNFANRLESKLRDRRLDFLLGEASKSIEFEDAVRQFTGHKTAAHANITIIELGGIPFEVLSITVSLITRMLFEFGYHYKRLLEQQSKQCNTPLLLVYEEAHKYVPKSDLAKYRSSKIAIERIAKCFVPVGIGVNTL